MADARRFVLTAEEIRSIAERAFTVLEETPGPFDDDDEDDDAGIEEEEAAYVRTYPSFHAAREALRFLAAAAAALGDPSLVPLVARALLAQDQWDSDGLRDSDEIAASLAKLLKTGAAPTEEIEELAEHHDPCMRGAVAKGLLPRSTQSTALLEKLAQDPLGEVRGPAQETLAALHEVPWWHGKFASDPVARLSPEEAERHKETLETLSALLDKNRWELLQRDEELCGVVGALPDVLAVEAARLVLSSGDYITSGLPHLGAMMVARPGGMEAFCQVVEAWGALPHFFVRNTHVGMIAGTPPEVRAPAALALARWAMDRPLCVRTEHGSVAQIAVEIAACAYPVGADLRPFLELAMSEGELPRGENDWAAFALRHVFQAPGSAVDTIAEHLVEARLENFAGRHHALAAHRELLLRLPKERLRAAAEAATQRHEDATVGWGLARLLLDVHDPARDPEPLDMVRAFWGEPRLRRGLLAEHAVHPALLVPLREGLRAGELEFEEAHLAAEIIDDFWGSLIAPFHFWGPSDAAQVEETCAKKRAQFAAFLGPASLHGPLDEVEWAAYRRARARITSWDYLTHLRVLHVLPLGPWHPEDRPVLERCVALCETHEHLIGAVAGVLAQKPAVEDLPVFHRLARFSRTHRSDLRQAYRVAREALGVRGGPEAATGAAAAAQEWMDEPEA
jgi:hypothetical protein